MRAFLQRRWFLIALLALLVMGQQLGASASEELFDRLQLLSHRGVKSALICGVLFLMSITLDSRRLRGAIARPGPAAWAIAVNIGLIPLAAPLLMPLQLDADMAAGLLVAMSVPCTLAAASVWTRRAGGNDAVSLVVTMVTNAGCFLFTPFWLRRFAESSIELNVEDMILQLFITAFAPTLLGQLCRRSGRLAAAVDRRRSLLGGLAQVGILVTVFSAACDAGRRMTINLSAADVHPAPTVAALAVITVSCIGVHLAAMAIAGFGGRRLGFARGDWIAAAFAGSQKTLPIGVLIATDPGMFGERFPWAVYPMLIFHAGQLFIDTTVADRLRAAACDASTANGAAGSPPPTPPATSG